MITKRKLQSTEIVSVKRQGVNICVVVIQVIALYKGHLKKEERTEKTDEKVSIYNQRVYNTITGKQLRMFEVMTIAHD